MSRLEKDIERLKLRLKDYTYDEVRSLLNRLGFFEYNKGKTSGSVIEFKNQCGNKIMLHKPHPNNILKPYIIKAIIKSLEEWRII